MSRNSFTSSERRGVIAIALIALAIVGAGIGISFCERLPSTDDYPIVNEQNEMADSTAIINSDYQKNSGSKSGNKSKKGKDGKKKSGSKKEKKTYRQRSPLDEPV